MPAKPRRDPAEDSARGLTDQQVVGMIEVLSRHLSAYVKEWDRRQEERK